MTGDISEMTSRMTERFRYNEQGKVIHLDVVETHSVEEWPASNYSESFQYDGAGLLSEYTRGEVNVKISRNINGFIDLVEIIKNNQLLRWYTFEYLVNGLRQSSQAFNGSGEQEFSIEYVYEYYD